MSNSEIEKKATKATIVSVVCYIGTDLLVTAICSLSLTPYMLSLGLSNFAIIMCITFISFISFGLLYALYKKIKSNIKSNNTGNTINTWNDVNTQMRNNLNTVLGTA